jgi:predicted Fe-S protein YdhL (DUF1289 family)
MSKELTPCIKVCEIENNLCKGCYRTLDEIAQWRHLNEEEKKQIISLCDRRANNND